MFSKFFKGREEKKMMEEIVMLDEMHADVSEEDDPCRPEASIVSQIVDVAELQVQLPEEARAQINIVPYDFSAIVNENVIGMAAYAEGNKIALAYCEDPKFIWVDCNAIRSIEERDWGCYHSLKENGDWRYLLRLLWAYGHRLAKVKFLEDGVDIKSYKL